MVFEPVGPAVFVIVVLVVGKIVDVSDDIIAVVACIVVVPLGGESTIGIGVVICAGAGGDMLGVGVVVVRSVVVVVRGEPGGNGRLFSSLAILLSSAK